MVEIPLGMLFGFFFWFFLRYGFGGFYTVAPSERAVFRSPPPACPGRRAERASC